MRRIKKAEVIRLALCKRGKNGLRTLYKSDGTAEFATLVKGDAEKGELLAVMWPKGLADFDGDFADTAEAIDSMMASLIANGGQLDIEHDGQVLPREAVEITEVFSIQPGDERFQGWEDYDGVTHDVTGGAAVRLQLNDPDLRASYRDGDWDGVSLFGPAAVEEVDDSKAAGQRVAARLGKSASTDNDMNEELKKALAEFKGEIVDMVKSAVAELKPAEPAANANEPTDDTEAPTAPEFTGDASNPEDLEAFQRELRAFEVNQKIASGEMTADEIGALVKSMRETGPSDEEAGIEEGDSDEVRNLKKSLFKAQKRSNASATRGVDAAESDVELTKAHDDEVSALAEVMSGMAGNSAKANGMRVVPKG